jgi:hypothetical protein
MSISLKRAHLRNTMYLAEPARPAIYMPEAALMVRYNEKRLEHYLDKVLKMSNPFENVLNTHPLIWDIAKLLFNLIGDSVEGVRRDSKWLGGNQEKLIYILSIKEGGYLFRSFINHYEEFLVLFDKDWAGVGDKYRDFHRNYFLFANVEVNMLNYLCNQQGYDALRFTLSRPRNSPNGCELPEEDRDIALDRIRFAWFVFDSIISIYDDVASNGAVQFGTNTSAIVGHIFDKVDYFIGSVLLKPSELIRRYNLFFELKYNHCHPLDEPRTKDFSDIFTWLENPKAENAYKYRNLEYTYTLAYLNY